MGTETAFPERVELSIAQPEGLVLVENHKDEVVIRVARDNFSTREKSFLVRYLAEEGYIPERYRWFADQEPGCCSGLRWIVDNSRIAPVMTFRRKAHRQILRLILCTSLVWLALMIYAFLHASH